MINKARITVDSATRQVLDELSEHLAQVPPWAGDMREEFRDAMSDIRDAPAKSLSKLGEAVASRQTSQDRVLAQLSDAVKALEEPIGKQQVEIEAFASKVDELLVGSGALHAIGERQEQAIAKLREDQERMLSACEQASATTQEGGSVVRAMNETLERAIRQQEDFRANVIETLQGVGGQLRELRTTQASQSDALLSVMQRLETRSHPWWKKLL